MEDFKRFADDVRKMSKQLKPELELFRKYKQKEEQLKAELARKKQEYLANHFDNERKKKTDFEEFCQDTEAKLAKLQELKHALLKRHQTAVNWVFKRIDRTIRIRFEEVGLPIPNLMKELIRKYPADAELITIDESEGFVASLEQFWRQLESQGTVLADLKQLKRTGKQEQQD